MGLEKRQQTMKIRFLIVLLVENGNALCGPIVVSMTGDVG